jgi:ParB family chromosome partitioning protein
MDQSIFKTVSIDSIRFDPNNIRRDYQQGLFDSGLEDIEHLASSIAEVGLIEPLIVCASDSGFELIAGERRLRALQLLRTREPSKYTTVTVKVYTDVSQDRKKLIQLVENVQRKDLSDYDKVIAIAEGFEFLRKQIDPDTGKLYTQTKYAALVGMSVSNLSSYLSYVRRPPIIEALKDGLLGLGTANLAARLDDNEIRELIARVKTLRAQEPGRYVTAADVREQTEIAAKRVITADYTHAGQSIQFAGSSIVPQSNIDAVSSWIKSLEDDSGLEDDSENKVVDAEPTSAKINDLISQKFGDDAFDLESSGEDTYAISGNVKNSISQRQFSAQGAAFVSGLTNFDKMNMPSVGVYDTQNFMINIDKARLILSKFYPDANELSSIAVFDRLETFLKS